MIRQPCVAVATLIALSAASVHAQTQSVVLDRDGSTIVLEPYAPNIIRVTLSLLKEPATDAPGYGLIAHPPAREGRPKGAVSRPSRLVFTLGPTHPGRPCPRDLTL